MRTKCSIALAALLLGCWPEQPDCTSPKSQSRLFGATDCPRFVEAEERVVLVFGEARGLHYTPEVAVRNLTVRAELRDGGVFVDQDGGHSAGYASCNEHQIRLASDDFCTNAYAHEVMHIATACAPYGGPKHELWLDAGYLALIDRAQRCSAKLQQSEILEATSARVPLQAELRGTIDDQQEFP